MAERLPTVSQTSAGGVVLRRAGGVAEVVITLTAEGERWQLPKGMIDEGESVETAALREVREEAGLECRIVRPIETIEYWYVGSYDGTRKRYHKKVHFFLMEYISGDTADHDHEVLEVRWVPVSEAVELLSFKSEKDVVSKAAELADARNN